MPPPPPGPSPLGAVWLAAPWGHVGRASSAGSVAGPDFSVPFGGSVESTQAMAAGLGLDPEDCCYLEESEDLRRMEADLARAVVVSITGSMPRVDLADAAAALHAEFGLCADDMSTRPFFPEDFLVICTHPLIRQLIMERGRAPGADFSLSLRPWTHQAQTTGVSVLFLVPLELVGVPAHAWTRRADEVVLGCFGFVVQVAEHMARWHDMAGFRVWLKTVDPSRIPRRRLLLVSEPADALVLGGPDALWYPVSIRCLAPPVRANGTGKVPPPPRLPLPPASPPSDADALGGSGNGGSPPGLGRRSASASGVGSPASSSSLAPPARQRAGPANVEPGASGRSPSASRCATALGDAESRGQSTAGQAGLTLANRVDASSAESMVGGAGCRADRPLDPLTRGAVP